MKKVITILSAFFIITGLKAQKVTTQKETVKPLVKSPVKQDENLLSKKTTVQQKEYKNAPAVKLTPAIKKAAPAVESFKKTTVQQ